ncbi:MAG: nicotinic acid mononucleotide adenylyltransferase [Desulfobacterales bacterium CG07_land_8_20_14_0_80_52_14]|nr:MAG: nicotinic acid mononucleotide adenylyltransferase [Desulfobacterales bacterium CG23_combo_of_CG06-09_8_20_14_all_52_9]PIU49373.1 MAG: nicotinic acid mononucleotide adenylyltransferase [Desulfobacterales bacterium CG07_land_8_20_14_0_80_52_14]
MMNRVGLFGGTFDPIHRGHLTAAKKVKKAFMLDEVVFIPSAVPPHKEGSRVTPAADRLAMLRLALTGTNGFKVTDCEIRRPGPSYTVDTVRFFLENAHGKTQMYLILGHDAFLEMHTWKSFEKILEQIPLIVIRRPGGISHSGSISVSALEVFITTNLSCDYRLSEDGTRYQHPRLKPIHLFQNTLLKISSTDIRKGVQSGKSVRAWVPETVETYLIEKGLYR